MIHAEDRKWPLFDTFLPPFDPNTYSLCLILVDVITKNYLPIWLTPNPQPLSGPTGMWDGTLLLYLTKTTFWSQKAEQYFKQYVLDFLIFYAACGNFAETHLRVCSLVGHSLLRWLTLRHELS